MTSPGQNGPSRTSIYVAAGRAIGALEPDPSVRNPDSLVERLLGDPASLDVDHPAVLALGRPYDEAMASLEVMGCVTMMMVRTGFIDQAVRRAVTDGATQLVILGAGFDTRAYRLADLLTDALVFEVDRPQTQSVKQQRATEALGPPPGNLRYVPIDFEHEDLAGVLAAHGHDPARRTCLVWEGVTMYLPAEAARSTLAFAGTHASGSTIVFDYMYQGVIDRIRNLDVMKVPEAFRPATQRFLDLISREPWVFGLPDRAEREFLGQFGLEVREILAIGGAESINRYLTRADGTTVGGARAPQPGAGPGPMYHLVEAVRT